MTAVPAQDAYEPAPQTNDDIKTFVSAIAVVLGETVAGFEQTVSRITDLTTMREGRADRDLVVALQDFDRLQQEFATLSEVLAKLSALSGAGALVNGADPAHPVLAMISIAALKDRLARQLRDLTADLSGSDTSEEVIF
ncbi:MAG TPA: hypothetical protein VI251_18925 [Pseudolabrys sp.]